MVFKKFRLIVVGRIVLLSATLFVFLYLLSHTTFHATTTAVAVFFAYQVYALIRYVEKTNQDLSRFLRSLKYADFSQTFSSTERGSSFDELHAAFTEVANEFRRARAEKEEHFRYLQTVVQHIGVGLLSFRRDGAVELINTAAKRLLHVTNLHNIRSLESFSKPLVETLLGLKSGEKVLLKIEDHNDMLQLAIYATEFRLREQQYTLVSLQNIRSELDEKEMEAWQKLIRVLTHEIMNSITPISSLASTASELLKSSTQGSLSPQGVNDVRSSIETIEKRSQGLLHFVDKYRNLIRVPHPNFKVFRIGELFSTVEQLMKPQVGGTTVRFQSKVEPESLELTADPELVEQVLINLLLNALHAVQDQSNGLIQLRARMDERGRITVEVVDNGPGISREAKEKIFVPFFTTKQEGSGIGLSLSKEIMRLHKGTIQFHSLPGKETVFRLTF